MTALEIRRLSKEFTEEEQDAMWGAWETAWDKCRAGGGTLRQASDVAHEARVASMFDILSRKNLEVNHAFQE